MDNGAGMTYRRGLGWHASALVAKLAAPDICPHCGRLQANVNNAAYLWSLRPDQRAKRDCMDCGFNAWNNRFEAA